MHDGHIPEYERLLPPLTQLLHFPIAGDPAVWNKQLPSADYRRVRKLSPPEHHKE